MREATEFRPKPMVMIGSHPILWHIMKYYNVFGVKDFVLCLGYRGDIIRDFFINYRNYSSDIEVDLQTGDTTILRGEEIDWRVRLIETGIDTMTGARLKIASRYVEGDSCYVTYGDGLSTVDLKCLHAFHRQSGKPVTVTAVHPPSRFGELQIGEGVARSFREKPQTSDGWINGGFMVFETAQLHRLRDGDELSLEADVLGDLSARGELAVFPHEGFWQCMDTQRESTQLNELWAGGAAPWKVW